MIYFNNHIFKGQGGLDSNDLGPNYQRHSISGRIVNTGDLLIAQIHGYLLGLKSIKTLIVGLQKI